MKNHFIARGLLFGIGFIALILGVAWIVMMLWNRLLPTLFTGAAVINYYQALGLLVLSKILFGGWRGRGCCGGYGSHRGGYWKNRFKGKWEGMSEEEREKFRQCYGPVCTPEEKPENK